jgi:glycosyltransferase involved in cell wall biosynthesis
MEIQMDGSPLVSIVISSFNYEAFLKDAIESALGQTYANTETIVVDDASTDNSRAIIESFGSQVIAFLRSENKGGRETYNQVCELSRGEIILLLDSDDTLDRMAVENAVRLFEDPSVVKVHWPLWEIDAKGKRSHNIIPKRALPDGDLFQVALREGPCVCAHPPTSGNAWRRSFVQKALPIPGGAYADSYLAAIATVSGKIKRVSEPMGSYRVHGQNEYIARTFDDRVKGDLTHYELCCNGVARFASEFGSQVDPDVLLRKSWYYDRFQAVEEIKNAIPESATLILVDQDNWATGGSIAGRAVLPFTEKDGYYAGTPPDDKSALLEFERLRTRGAAFIVFAWPAFWWLEYFTGLRTYLRTNFRIVLENSRLMIFDLRDSPCN